MRRRAALTGARLCRELARYSRAFALRWLARLSGRRIGIVLLLHGVGPETGDRRIEIVPPIDRRVFERHVRHLRRHYEIVAPSTVRAAAARRRRGQRVSVALTFDDDLASHADEVAPVLRRLEVPAAFFVCGASLDAAGRFWWQDLQDALDRRLLDASDLVSLPSDVVDAAIAGRDRGAARLAAAIEELSPAARATVARALRERVGDPPSTVGLRRQGVRSLVAAGFEVGFHTLRHDRLPPLDDAELDAAFQDGRAAVEAATGHSLTTLSYPHGRADARVAAAAVRHGFVVGFTAGARVVRETDNPLLLPRIEPTAASSGAFALQIARFACGQLPR